MCANNILMMHCALWEICCALRWHHHVKQSESVMVWSCLEWHSWRCGRSLRRRQDCVSRQYRVLEGFFSAKIPCSIAAAEKKSSSTWNSLSRFCNASTALNGVTSFWQTTVCGWIRQGSTTCWASQSIVFWKGSSLQRAHAVSLLLIKIPAWTCLWCSCYLLMLYVVDDGCHGECGMRDRWKEEPRNCIEIDFWSPSVLWLWFWCVTFSFCCWWHFNCCRRLVFWLWLYQDGLELLCASWRWNLANWILFITYDINICFMHLADLGLMLDDGARPTFW